MWPSGLCETGDQRRSTGAARPHSWWGCSRLCRGCASLRRQCSKPELAMPARLRSVYNGVRRMIFPALHWCASKGLRCKAVRRIARSR
ncbi:Unknown protein sequence [Pseudomonas savastanoi pv. glycinea]|uniref:DUF1534 domain-containing protein n=1 Tax=Pseudomonas savastanoi pv. glycinea TaxID=318 RepID=A0ABR5LGM4_PSESG|nr:Unknown protein sequence [Pseudomonas savastanoi pv. phaseolicola]KPB68960.1 Unknown protein sequence [Pseudomonas amygdali pv. mellea]KPB88416.1 Unknown protein sequence [Pseudomonas syringae pv. maculicola]KPC23154.1 Unknown protein sequence [Pseudomonas savastanoi pv. glycinea]KPB41618.1 Unknown protein sequence [Pseudomonas savastanoi pv. phaseolicola]